MELRKELSHKPFVLMCLVVRRTGGAAVFYYALGWCVCVRACACVTLVRGAFTEQTVVDSECHYQRCLHTSAVVASQRRRWGTVCSLERRSVGALREGWSRAEALFSAASLQQKMIPKWEIYIILHGEPRCILLILTMSKTALLQYRRRICNLLIYSFLIQSCGQIYLFFPYFPNGMVH